MVTIIVNSLSSSQAAREELSQNKPDDVQTEEEIANYCKEAARGSFAAWFAVPYLSMEALHREDPNSQPWSTWVND